MAKPNSHRSTIANTQLDRLALFSLLLAACRLASAADAYKRTDWSFRGPFSEELHIPHWDVSGSAYRLPTAKDFIRLAQPFPLTYGAIFTEEPIPWDQWSVEIAFRIHGGYSNHHGHRNDSHPIDAEEALGKGGRGLAFWYTKEANPTPLTAPANTHHHKEPMPSLSINPFPDPIDHKVSFFGGPTSFHGLAVVIDNQPTTPVTPRSDRKHWGEDDGASGAEQWAVVSGVMDDGHGASKFIEEKTLLELDEDDEAAYLSHSIGDCQVAIRNAAGIVWAKITHISGHLSVSLDLLPHTTLSGEARHYKRECFSASNVKLPRGYHMGITALSSPNQEPDNVDIYAIEVKEIKGKATSDDDVKEHYKEEHTPADDVKLEGTSKTSDPQAMAFDSLNAQRQWIEQMKKMGQRLESMGGQAPTHADGVPPADNSASSPQISTLEHKIDQILEKLSSGTHGGSLLTNSDVMQITQKMDTLETHMRRHELFISEQIEDLRTLVIRPPSPDFEDDHHFVPLEHLHDKPLGTTHGDGHHAFDHRGLSPDRPRSMLNFISWVIGILTIFGIGYKLGQRRNQRNRFDGDEGSYIHGSSGNSALSMTMDAFGFRQRNKKMI